MSSNQRSYALGATQLVVAPGATNALLVSPAPGEVSHGIKYISGGSLEILAPPLSYDGYAPGSTWTGASLVALLGRGYLMGTSEADNIDGPARYYLMATGATAIAHKLISYS